MVYQSPKTENEIAAAFVRTAAYIIAAAPPERRGMASAAIEGRFNTVFLEILGDNEITREKLRRQVIAVRNLVRELEASGDSQDGAHGKQ